jgi:hypothetical protein
MDTLASLNHSVWDCKYHVVLIPKCRRRTLYGELRPHLETCAWSRDPVTPAIPTGGLPRAESGAMTRASPGLPGSTTPHLVECHTRGQGLAGRFMTRVRIRTHW